MDERLLLADQLLLAQAVHHVGTSPPEWQRVSQVILEHPLVANDARTQEFAKKHSSASELFSPSACETNWNALMGIRGIVDAARVPRTDKQAQLSLAQLLYADRIVEIQSQIHQREQHYRAVFAQLEDLKAGKLDSQLVKEAEKNGVTVLGDTAKAPAEESSMEIDVDGTQNSKEEAQPDGSTQQDENNEKLHGEPSEHNEQVEQHIVHESQETKATEVDEPTTSCADPTLSGASSLETGSETKAAVNQTNAPTADSSEDEDLQVEQDLLGDDNAELPGHENQEAPLSAESHSAPTTYGKTRRRSERVRDDEETARDQHRGPSLEEETGIYEAEREKTRRRTVQLLLMLLEQVESHTHSSVFEQPIKEAVRDY